MHRETDGEVRYATTVEDGQVYVGSPEGRLVVGDLDRVVELAGGPAWTVEYTDRQKRRHPDLDTADEGLTVDVTDVLREMTHDRSFVETLRAQPTEAPTDDPRSVAPRVGLFVGRLVSNLQYGID